MYASADCCSNFLLSNEFFTVLAVDRFY